MLADAENVTVLNGFSVYSLTAELDAIGGAHIDHIEVATGELDEGMLTRDIGISNRQIGGGLSAADDEAVLTHKERVTLVVDSQGAGDGYGRWLLDRCAGGRRGRGKNGRGLLLDRRQRR